MVRITEDLVGRRDEFAAAGLALPRFDIAAARAGAAEAPRWLHIGPGNLFRAFHAQLAQVLLDEGALASGVIVAGTLWREEITQIYDPFDNRHVIVVMNPDGTLHATLNAAVARALYAGDEADRAALLAIGAAPSLQLVTVTITEKGYAQRDESSAMVLVTALLRARWEAGGAPLALVSTDNFSANGDRFREAILEAAREPGFADYVADRTRVSFPCTMIDRITPNPSPEVADALTAQGIEDMALTRVSASTVMAPFANTEPVSYLVAEDDFPNGRPPLERAGVLMTDRRTVNLVDEMKVTACLNPLHTALAVFGMLLGFDRIWREMGDPDLATLVRRLGVEEMLPVCPDPGIIAPARFLEEVLETRLPNPALPDAPGRIAADTSQKLPIRYGEALRRYLARGRDLAGLRAIPLVMAGWVRYLAGVDDAGAPLTLSPDPRLDELTARLRDGGPGVAVPLLSEVVGVDLAATPLAARVAADLAAMSQGPGAVRARLHEFATDKVE